MVSPTCFGITLPFPGSIPSAFCEMLNWAVDRILWMGVLCLVTCYVAIWAIATYHVTRHNTPSHNILSTAPQLSISQLHLNIPFLYLTKASYRPKPIVSTGDWHCRKMRIIKLRDWSAHLQILSLEALQRAANRSVQVIKGKTCQRDQRCIGFLVKRSLMDTDVGILFVFSEETYRGHLPFGYVIFKL
jgi:hypothetical protein